MIKKLLSLCVVLLLSVALQAHEFWIQPDKFHVNPGETVLIQTRQGSDFAGEETKLSGTLKHFYKSFVKELKPIAAKGQGFGILLQQEGTHLLVAETTDSVKTYSTAEFKKYLEDNALDDILYQLQKNESAITTVTENYSFHTKLLLQAGKITDDTYKKNVGLPVEIIPGRNPYTLKKGVTVKFKILYNGKPYFGAKVKVWNRHNNRTTIQNIFAQQDGMIETHISNSGVWMLSVVKMMPSTDGDGHYKSYNGSLVFEIE